MEVTVGVIIVGAEYWISVDCWKRIDVFSSRRILSLGSIGHSVPAGIVRGAARFRATADVFRNLIVQLSRIFSWEFDWKIMMSSAYAAVYS